MKRINDGFVFSPTDLTRYLACGHLTTLSVAVANKEASAPWVPKDPRDEALSERGRRHERRILDRMRAEGRSIEDFGDSSGNRADATLQAMRRGVEVIYQGRLDQGAWRGFPDFLVRANGQSEFGDWSYEAMDAKLAREPKAAAVLQLAAYSDLLAAAQGCAPEYMTLVLGGMEPRKEKFRVDDFAAFFRSVRRRFTAAVESPPETYPEPVDHCPLCDWNRHCQARRRDDDHLSLVAGISRNQRNLLEEKNGTTTLEGLAHLPENTKLKGTSQASFQRVRKQARIQAEARAQKRRLRELILPTEPEKGLLALPEPSPGDIFFDIEGAPFFGEAGLEYLLGHADAAGAYTGLWAFDRKEERRQFERLVDFIVERRKTFPDLHVYHYGGYETGAMKRLMSRYATREDEVDDFLREGVFVDLLRVVRQGVRASVESYSIKKMEAFYEYERDTPLDKANRAIARFEAGLEMEPDAAPGAPERPAIEGYNRDDCISTLRLREWLEGLRRKLVKAEGPQPRPQPREPGKPGEQAEEVASLMAELTADLPESEAEWTDEHRARQLLAHLLEFHRREKKSMWWEYFERCGMDPDELVEDRSTLGDLTYEGPVKRIKQSTVHRYRFPPQDHEIKVGSRPSDPKTNQGQKGPGEVIALDDSAETIDLRRATNSPAPHPQALVPLENIPDKALKNSLFRLAEQVRDHGFSPDSTRRAALDLLRRARPKFAGGAPPPGAPIAEPGAASKDAPRLASALDRSVLAIQGPPGSGKTYTGARIILKLLAARRRVGVTGPSHKVISNLLDAVCEAAEEQGHPVCGIQKSRKEEGGATDTRIEKTDDNDEVRAALDSGVRLVGGTVWLWARDEFEDAVDFLVVDEAAQMSLANTLAASSAAASLVLLGDPQQLNQPIQGHHPEGSAVSVLEHLMADAKTLPKDRGLFLDHTWRMTPKICRFTSEQFYEDRLDSRDGLERQCVIGPGLLGGQGLRFFPVEHQGKRKDSQEEAARVRDLISELLHGGARWRDRNGMERELTLNDIMVVAPYNAQVQRIKNELPGVRVGTVDKFQGRQAPIVLYSMATSTPAEAPRGMEFLYSLNRLNVATSRARCVAAVVANPALLAPDCRTPDQMRLANALCRFVELAEAGGGAS